MKSATSKELMFDQDHTSCMRKPCARPLPPYLLYKVSKFCYDISFPFHCHLLLTSPCKRWWVKASTQSRDCGVWVVLGGAFWFVFFSVLLWLYLHTFFSPCPFPAFLLCSVTVYEPSLERAAERTYSNSCHGQLGAEVSSNISFGFSQELRWWDFSPCCTLSLRESCALQWSVPLPRKPYTGSPVLSSCTHTPKSHAFCVVLLTICVNLSDTL